MQPCVIILHGYLCLILCYGHMVAITTVCAGVGLSLIVDPIFRLPSLIKQNFAAWSMSLSVILTVSTVIFSGIWSALDGWAFIDWLLINCIVATTKKVIAVVLALILLNVWSWFLPSWRWTDFRKSLFPACPGPSRHSGIKLLFSRPRLWMPGFLLVRSISVLHPQLFQSRLMSFLHTPQDL